MVIFNAVGPSLVRQHCQESLSLGDMLPILTGRHYFIAAVGHI